MRFSLTSLLFIVLVAFTANGQEMPTSNGACSVSASGTMLCEGLSAPPIRWPNGETSKVSPKGVFVWRYAVQAGAPLHLTPSEDSLIVAMCDGEMVNEAKAPNSHVTITNGLVMLIRKGEPILLRNNGAKSLDLVVITVRK